MPFKHVLPVVLTAALITPAAGAGDGVREKLGTRPALTLEAARTLAAEAESMARRNGWSICIAIADDAGRLLYFARMDGTSNACVDTSLAKARHAVNYRRPTAFHQQILEQGNAVVLGLPDGMPLEGGVPLLLDEAVIGAVGIAGARSDQDGQLAQAAAALLEP